ncbi:MAG: glycoside hydrolase family 88 protein [Bacteroidota bacterium]|nr:glycoside hydrolase family 88 protein [Bacteroidota bacterium]
MHKYFLSLFILLGILGFSMPCFPASVSVDLSSPDGSVQFKVTSIKKQLYYTVLMNGKTVIEPSPMVMKVDSLVITKNIRIGEVNRYTINETYPWYGLHSTAIDHCNGAQLTIKSMNPHIGYTLDIRVFNDAVAFRFIIPGTDNKQRYPDEATVFTIPAHSIAWYHDLKMHYEGVHVKSDLDSVGKGRWAAMPVTIKLPESTGYAAITEADLKNYEGLALQTDGKNGFAARLAHSQPPSYPYVLRYSKEDVAHLSKIASVTGTISTPWRVVMMGKDLNTLVNCDALHNLCPSPDKNLFPDGLATSWIHPGRAVWKYLDGGGSNTFENMKEFSRKAGELGFEHNIIEGFWSQWTDDQIRNLVAYSNRCHVGIWVWEHSKSLRDTEARHAFLQKCHDLGITGIKIDFFDNESKDGIDLYQSLLKETAELKLLVDFHGANKPTGQSRTWPNELTREAVKGMEASKLADRATHNTTLPFTRFLAGPAEYTPVHFGERRKNTTWAHQVASAAILSAPLLTYAANPDHLLSNPAVEMIKSIPSTWDETRVLPSSGIGELAVYAQRKGNIWFLSVMNGNSPKTLKIPLSFLNAKTPSPAFVLKDDLSNRDTVSIENTIFSATDTLKIELLAGGGFIARFSPGNTKPRRGTSQGVANAHLDYKPGSTPESWSKATAESVMARYPDYRDAYWKPWSYVHGYMFHGFEMLYKSTGDRKYLDFIKTYIDKFVDDKGNFHGDNLNSLDNLMTGSSIVALYEYTGDERYKKAAMQFRKVFDTYPRSNDGQFWHGMKTPDMWIDGIFMGQMFLIRYGQVIGDKEYCIDEAARQIKVFARHCEKDGSGLYLHAWTENPAATKWADPKTGLSPEVWSEGLGWYALVVSELLAVMPESHPQYASVLDIYKRMMAGLKKNQDPVSGGWFMIVDKGNQPGNWIDPSGTSMFVYSIQKGIDIGVLDKKEYENVARRGFESLLTFAAINEKGLVDVHGGGDGISVKNNYAAYVNYPRMVNAKETLAGFLWASAIMEKTEK